MTNQRIKNEVDEDLPENQVTSLISTTLTNPKSLNQKNEKMALYNNYETQTTIELEEHIDKKSLAIIIANYEEICASVGRIDDGTERNDKTNVLTLLKNLLKSKSTKKYMKSKKSDFNSGRLFTPTSLQGCMREFRHTISKDIYFDFDVENAHPSFLLWYSNVNNIPNKCLNLYVKNRDKYFNDLKVKMGLGRSDAKELLLKMLNGGGGNFLKKKNCPSWLQDLYSELDNARHRIAELNPKLFARAQKYNKTKDWDNSFGSCANYLFCEIEDKVLQCMVQFCNNNDVKVGVLCFDGLMAEIKSFQYLDIPSFLHDMNKFVLDTIGIPVVITQKKMDQGIDLQIYIEKRKKILDQNPLVKDEELYIEQEDVADIIIKFLIESKNVYYHNCRKKVYIFNDVLKLFEESDADKLMNFVSLVITPYCEEIIPLFKGSPVNSILLCKFKSNLKTCAYQYGVKKIILNKIVDSSDFIEDNFNKIAHLFPIANNKVINLQTLEVSDRVREHYFTYTTENIFNPGYDRTKVIQYISEILNTTEDHFINSFLQTFGYFLTDENDLKIFPILTGDGDNGKSVFLNLIKLIFGHSAIVASERVFFKQSSKSVLDEELVPLIGKRLAYLSEPDKNDHFNEKRIKQITGNDGKTSIRGAVGRTMEVALTCKLLLVCNQVPVFNDKEGFQNRLRIFPFSNHFDRDAEKVKYIMSLKDDLFNELCYQCKTFYDNEKTIKFSSEILNATTEHINDVDHFKSFFNDNYEITNDDNDRISKILLYASYIENSRVEKFESIGRNVFYKRCIKDYNLELYRKTHFKGIKLISQDDFEDQPRLLPENDL